MTAHGYDGTPGAPRKGRPACFDHLLVAAPAAGAGIVQKLDSAWSWRILSARFSLTTDANAGNRVVTVDYCDPEGTVWIRNGVALTWPANTAAQDFELIHDGPATSWAAGTSAFGRLSDIWIPGGWQLKVSVANAQVGDQLSALRLYVEKLSSG